LKACLVDSADYLLRCVRYIDPNPIRARIINDPVRFRWCSCAAQCGQRHDPLPTLHPEQRALGATAQEGACAYRQLLAEAISEKELAGIRDFLQQQRVDGSDASQRIVGEQTRRFAGVRPAHRPRKQTTGK
jgi:putative transposase